MRTRTLLPLFVLALTSFGWGQGTVAMGTPAVTNALGQPMGNASVAIVSVFPGLNPAVPPVANLLTLYTDQTLGTQCSGTAGTQPLNNQASPSVGAGCSNPGLADNNGNVIAFGNAGLNWCVFYGNAISTKVQPCMFSVGSSGGLVTSLNGRVGAVTLGTNDISPEIAGTGGGTAQVQTVTLSPPATALTFGLQVVWLPVANNTGAAPTLNVNGLGARPITKLGTTALVANDITTLGLAWAIYDGTEWQLQNPQTAAAGTPAFSAITAGTNTNALLIGTGGSLGTSGTGTIIGTSLTSAGWGSPGAIGTGTPAAGNFTTGSFAGQLTATTSGTTTFAATCGATTCAAINIPFGGGTINFNTLTSTSSNPSATGSLRLSSTDPIKARNNANNADVVLVQKDSSDITNLGGTAGIKTAGPAVVNGSGDNVVIITDNGASMGNAPAGQGQIGSLLGIPTWNYNAGATANTAFLLANQVNAVNGIAGLNGQAVVAPAQLATNPGSCNNTTFLRGDNFCTSVSGAAQNTVVNAWCGGAVGTASLTSYYLEPFLNGTSISCQQSAGTDIPIPYACTAQNLFVKAGTAGAVAGSGVVTFFKNGSSQLLTCTLGTGTTCNDTTHTVALAQGDTYSVKVTTGQASDTTANVRASFQCK